jgi:hypothetical protein
MVFLFYRANDYVPNREETEMLRQCTSRLRLYTAVGFIGAGSLVSAVLRVSQKSIQFNRVQKITWIACSSVVGAYIGLQTAGPACLKQVVALPSSPMAVEARRLYVPPLFYPNLMCNDKYHVILNTFVLHSVKPSSIILASSRRRDHPPELRPLLTFQRSAPTTRVAVS